MSTSSPSSSSSAAATTTTANPRGIPHFPFLPHATDYVKAPADVGPTLDRFQEMIQKYTFMQQNVEKRLAGLKEKVPEMRSSLDTVRFLMRKRGKGRKAGSQPSGPAELEATERDLDGGDDALNGEAADVDADDAEAASQTGALATTFPLADTLHAHALLSPADIADVYLWLGANVMVAYPLAEAQALLESKLAKAKEGIAGCEEDLEFLRVQITTLEVATARVYNWDVGERRRRGEKGGGGKEGGAGEE